MAWAVPALLGGVPVQVAAKVCAHSRAAVQRASSVTAYRKLMQAIAQDAALPGLELFGAGDFGWHEVLGKILDDGHVLAEVIYHARNGFAGGLVDFRPRVRT